VTARAKLAKLIGIRRNPGRKAVVVIDWSNQARAACRRYAPVIRDDHLCIGAVHLFRLMISRFRRGIFGNSSNVISCIRFLLRRLLRRVPIQPLPQSLLDALMRYAELNDIGPARLRVDGLPAILLLVQLVHFKSPQGKGEILAADSSASSVPAYSLRAAQTASVIFKSCLAAFTRTARFSAIGMRNWSK
jgi:hypothetical protein